jgi:hypothetical protein
MLVELLKVETNLLLVDALEPHAPVADSSSRRDTKAQWQAPEPVSRPPEAEDSDEEMQQGQEQEEQAQEQQQAPAVSQAQQPSSTEQRPGQQQAYSTAGERAAHLLPVCLQLWEALVELLASQMELLDGLMGEGAQLQVPLLGEATASRLMHTLQEVTGYLVEFLEERRGQVGAVAL